MDFCFRLPLGARFQHDILSCLCKSSPCGEGQKLVSKPHHLGFCCLPPRKSLRAPTRQVEVRSPTPGPTRTLRLLPPAALLSANRPSTAGPSEGSFCSLTRARPRLPGSVGSCPSHTASGHLRVPGVPFCSWGSTPHRAPEHPEPRVHPCGPLTQPQCLPRPPPLPLHGLSGPMHFY